MSCAARGRRGLVFLASFLLAASAANAATIKVTTTSDSGTGAGDCTMTDQACSLRQAVNAAPNGDIVKVPAGKYTLTQTSQSLYIATNITLSGAGARKTIIKQVNELGVVAINTGVTATIQGV